MCGIVGAIAERNVVPILVEGLRRLEYRGYDSAGMAILQDDRSIGLCDGRQGGRAESISSRRIRFVACSAWPIRAGRPTAA